MVRFILSWGAAMAIAAFDTLEFVESLESSGFTKEHPKGW